jgi:hypothetical protein
LGIDGINILVSTISSLPESRGQRSSKISTLLLQGVGFRILKVIESRGWVISLSSYKD